MSMNRYLLVRAPDSVLRIDWTWAPVEVLAPPIAWFASRFRAQQARRSYGRSWRQMRIVAR
jgi:hypothetical protein